MTVETKYSPGGNKLENYTQYGTSYNEQLIFLALRHFYPDTINRCRVLKDKFKGGIEFDIAIPSIPLCIEYSPTSTHCGHFGDGGKRDVLKKELCSKLNIRYIVVIEDTFNKMQHYLKENEYCFSERLKNSINIYDIIESILKSLGKSIHDLDIGDIQKEAYSRSRAKCLPERSIKTLYPMLEQEWNDKNISIDEISPYSHMEVKWRCIKC